MPSIASVTLVIHDLAIPTPSVVSVAIGHPLPLLRGCAIRAPLVAEYILRSLALWLCNCEHSKLKAMLSGHSAGERLSCEMARCTISGKWEIIIIATEKANLSI